MPELWQLDCYDQNHPKWFGETERVPCPVCGQPARAATRRRGKTLSERVEVLENAVRAVAVGLIALSIVVLGLSVLVAVLFLR